MEKIRFYDDVKAKHPGVMIIFRCGDFYETYCDDAVEASRILGITLTVHSERTESNGQKLRIAIFPEHALTAYLPKLLLSGKRVAICCERESALGNDKKAENNSN